MPLRIAKHVHFFTLWRLHEHVLPTFLVLYVDVYLLQKCYTSCGGDFLPNIFLVERKLEPQRYFELNMMFIVYFTNMNMDSTQVYIMMYKWSMNAHILLYKNYPFHLLNRQIRTVFWEVSKCWIIRSSALSYTVLPLYTATFGETHNWRYKGGGGI